MDLKGEKETEGLAELTTQQIGEGDEEKSNNASFEITNEGRFIVDQMLS